MHPSSPYYLLLDPPLFQSLTQLTHASSPVFYFLPPHTPHHITTTTKMAICKAVEECDGGAKFRSDAWVRADGGGGISMVLGDGKVWEKAGCNLSVVYGSMPQEALQAATERGVDRAKGMKPGEF